MTTQHFQIDIANRYGKPSLAEISCEVEYMTENSTSRPLCSIRLKWETYDLYSSADDFFAAFIGIKEQLATIGAMPLCYAASRNVYPSMLLRDMALGLKAYKLTLNKKARSPDIVDIFDCGSGLEIVAVAEQDRFHKEWLDSLNNAYTEISDQEQ